MNKLSAAVLFSVFLFAGISCNTSYQPHSIEYKDYRINPSQAGNTAMLSVLKPYSDSVNKSMNDIIGVVERAMDKKMPEGSLGNFMADAFFRMAAIKFNTRVDIAMMNYGGIRLPQLPAGPVSRGKIFELMPFDNYVILQRVRGDVLQQLLDLIASRGGWPVAGMTMMIRDKKAVNVMIGGKPLDVATEYTVVNSDFVANGGDNAEMLRGIPQVNKGYLMRDALFDYINWLKTEGRNITANEENRVSYGQ